MDSVILLYDNNKIVPQYLTHQILSALNHLTNKGYFPKDDVPTIHSFMCMCIYESIDTPKDYDPNDGASYKSLMDKISFNKNKTHAVIITHVMSILNNLSRYHRSTIMFLIEKFHTEIIVWLVLNLLDSKTTNLFIA